jgi:hypothetical protein
MAALGVGLKIPRSVRVLYGEYQLQPYKWQTRPAYTFLMTERFYGFRAYSTPTLYRTSPMTISTNTRALPLRVDMGTNWGFPSPLNSTHQSEESVLVTMLVFPWNVLYVDDKRFDTNNTENADNFAVLKYSPGSHTTRYQFEPPAAWRTLKTLSHTFLVLLICSLPLLWWKSRTQKQ